MVRLGLTGGIGSGKSTVAHLLRDLGAALVDADEIARGCTMSGGAAIPAISKQFGATFLTSDGAVDRDKMRNHVFAHPASKRRLEAIVHPIVQQEMQRAAEAAGEVPCVVFDVPLLIESAHWRRQLDRILVVDCAESTQIERVTVRNGWSREQVERIIRQQSQREARLAAADWVISNDGISLTALKDLTQRLARQIGL